MKINIDHAENASSHLLIFLPQEPDIAQRKTEAYFVDIFGNIIAVITTISVFKSKIHDAVLMIIKASF